MQNASLHNVKFVKLPGGNKAKVVTRPILPGENYLSIMVGDAGLV